MSDKLRYTLSINVSLVVGEPKDFDVRDWTMTDFVPDMLLCNSPQPGFVLLDDIQVDAISVLPDGVTDAFDAGVKTDRDGSMPVRTAEEITAYLQSGKVLSRGLAITPTPCRHGVRVRGRYTGAKLVGMDSYAGPFILDLCAEGEVAS